MKFFQADNKAIRYSGRVDFSNPVRPRFWMPATTVQLRFRGPECTVILNDEVLWGKSHNFLEVVVDGEAPYRVQTTDAVNAFRIVPKSTTEAHTVTLCKDTEAGIGYLEFVGIVCEDLEPLPPSPSRKMEFYGDSITCGTDSDLSKSPCGTGEWYDRHNAYMSYGPTTARLLGAQWQVAAVSGIGLVHSCCDMKLTMPDVWDTVDVASPGKKWDFSRYQPDIVTICLGQNDGEQDPATFTGAYVQFIHELRRVYPKAHIVCLNSPMADDALKTYQTMVLAQVVQECAAAGDRDVHDFIFSRRYHGGCNGHPDVDEHQQIAAELAAYVRATFGW